ncbi:MAG: AMP-binding protein, partial [Proteobacteria bacterium]|nr:AMP-binding protein [Pseudomonadota bacterium]
MNLAQLLTNSAQQRPDHPAIVFGRRRVTFQELDQGSDRLAWGLQERGIAPGDRCVLMMPNSITWIEAYYALAKIGAVVVPVNFLYRPGELRHIFADSGARALIGHGPHLEYAAPVARALPAMEVLLAAGEDLPVDFT